MKERPIPSVFKKDDGKVIRYTIGGKPEDGEPVDRYKAQDIIERFEGEQLLYIGKRKNTRLKSL